MRFVAVLCLALAACGTVEEPVPVPVAPATPAPVAAKKAAPPAEAQVVGAAVGELDATDWLQGETSLADGEATLVVYWELWCPHCRRHLPLVEPTWASLQEKGLNVVAVTRLTKGVSREQAQAFVTESGITFPVAIAGDRLANELQIRGIPAAAVVRDGVVVWRGHPAQLDEAALTGWIGA